MAVKFFGQFLVEKGVVSSEQVLKAIELQEKVNLKFGEMALSMGMITDKDVDRVHHAQRTEDLKFGDMAVKLGIISEAQLNEVLTRQKNNHLYIGEALVRVGGLTEEQLPQLLAEFKEDQAPYMVDRVVIPAGVPNGTLLEICADLTYKMMTRIADIQFRPGACALSDEIGSNDLLVGMELVQDLEARYVLSVSSGVRRMVAEGILKQGDVTGESEEMLNDTVMEFVNVVCGNVSAKAAQLGKNIEIRPPEVLQSGSGPLRVPAGKTGLRFPIYVSDEKVELFLIT